MSEDIPKARAEAIAALTAGAPIEEVAEALFNAANEGAGEVSYSRGHRQALVGVLVHVLGGLGYEDTEATRAKWVIEREQTVAALRDICADHGDNDWPTDLNLGDVVSKHLARYLDEPESTR